MKRQMISAPDPELDLSEKIGALLELRQSFLHEKPSTTAEEILNRIEKQLLLLIIVELENLEP